MQVKRVEWASSIRTLRWPRSGHLPIYRPKYESISRRRRGRDGELPTSRVRGSKLKKALDQTALKLRPRQGGKSSCPLQARFGLPQRRWATPGSSLGNASRQERKYRMRPPVPCPKRYICGGSRSAVLSLVTAKMHLLFPSRSWSRFSCIRPHTILRPVRSLDVLCRLVKLC